MKILLKTYSRNWVSRAVQPNLTLQIHSVTGELSFSPKRQWSAFLLFFIAKVMEKPRLKKSLLLSHPFFPLNLAGKDVTEDFC